MGPVGRYSFHFHCVYQISKKKNSLATYPSYATLSFLISFRYVILIEWIVLFVLAS